MSETSRPSSSKSHATKKKPLARILIVDDEVFIQNAFKLYFETLGYDVAIAEDGPSALKAFRRGDCEFDVILLDLVMPGSNGIDLLRVFKSERPEVEVIIATGCGSIGSAIEAMRYGAFDYITKPIVDFENELLSVVEDALMRRHNRERNARSGEGATGEDASSRATIQALRVFEAMVGWNAEMVAATAAGEAPSVEVALQSLREVLGIRAGVFFRRESEDGGGLVATHAWGGAQRVPFEPRWFVDREAYDALCEGRFDTLDSDAIELPVLGLDVRDAGLHGVICHAPLWLEGRHRGAFLFFFDRDTPAFSFPGPLHGGEPFLLVTPTLGSLLLTSPEGTFDRAARLAPTD